MATNDITGDQLRSRANNKAFNDNFDRIFGVKHDSAHVRAGSSGDSDGDDKPQGDSVPTGSDAKDGQQLD